MRRVHKEFVTIEDSESGTAKTVTTQYFWDERLGQIVKEREWSHHPIGSDERSIERSEQLQVQLNACPAIVAQALQDIGVALPEGAGDA